MKLRLSVTVGVLWFAGGLFAVPELLWENGSAAVAFAEQDQAKDKPAAKDLDTQIQDAVRSNKIDQALELVEQSLKQKPDSPEKLALAMRLSQTMAMQKSTTDRPAANKVFLQSADYLRRLNKVRELTAAEKPFATTVLYNEACAYATSQKNKEALAALKESLDGGFADFDLIGNDADFAELRKLPEFAKIVEAARKVYQEKQKDQIKSELASNKPFDFDFKLDSVEGKKVQLADYKGKLLIVDFWGTWCPPCRKEIPHFVSLLEKYEKSGLRIVGINYEGDPAGAVEKIKAFASSNGIKYPCLIGDEATQKQVPEFRGYPTTLFVDGSGVVRLKIVGYHSQEHLETIVQLLLEKEKQGG